jgi:hypothetical protein
MNWDVIAAITQIVGVISVVATLIYLAIQTRQNALATQASVRQAMLVEDRELLMKHLDFPFLSPIHGKTEFSDDEKVQWATWVMAFMRARENHWLQYRAGGIDTATWKTYRAPIRYYLKTELGASFWSQYSRDMFDAEFVADVNTYLNDSQMVAKQEVRHFLNGE